MKLPDRVTKFLRLSVVTATRDVLLPGDTEPTTITVHTFPEEEQSFLNYVEATRRAFQSPVRRPNQPTQS